MKSQADILLISVAITDPYSVIVILWLCSCALETHSLVKCNGYQQVSAGMLPLIPDYILHLAVIGLISFE